MAKKNEILYTYEIVRVEEEPAGSDNRYKVSVNFDREGHYMYGSKVLENNYHSSSSYTTQEVITATKMAELVEEISLEVFECEFFTKAKEKNIADKLSELSTEEFAIRKEKGTLQSYVKENLLVGTYRSGIFVKPNYVTRSANPSKASGRETNFSQTGNKATGNLMLVDLNKDPKEGSWFVTVNMGNIISIVYKDTKYINKKYVKHTK